MCMVAVEVTHINQFDYFTTKPFFTLNTTPLSPLTAERASVSPSKRKPFQKVADAVFTRHQQQGIKDGATDAVIVGLKILKAVILADLKPVST